MVYEKNRSGLDAAVTRSADDSRGLFQKTFLHHWHKSVVAGEFDDPPATLREKHIMFGSEFVRGAQWPGYAELPACTKLPKHVGQDSTKGLRRCRDLF
jgi:hypothetical protein